MASPEDQIIKAELIQAIDDLALQVMVQGAEALTPASLASLISLAEKADRPDILKQAKAAAKPVKGKPLTEETSKTIVTKLQSLVATPTAKELEEEAAKAPESPAPAESFAFDEDPELLADFVMEADEHLTAIEEKILLLEKDPTLIDTIHAVFRSFHSIKGLAGFLGLTGVQTVAHEVETLLDHARNLRISVNSDVVDLVLESSEYLKEEVDVVRAKLALPSARSPG